MSRVGTILSFYGQLVRDVNLIYTAAHAGFVSEAVPLGGGGAVADQLLLEWRWTQPFARVEWLNPAVLGAAAPTGQALARFCVEFEHACTERVLQVRRSCDGNAQARLFCAGRSLRLPFAA